MLYNKWMKMHFFTNGWTRNCQTKWNCYVKWMLNRYSKWMFSNNHANKESLKNRNLEPVDLQSRLPYCVVRLCLTSSADLRHTNCQMNWLGCCCCCCCHWQNCYTTNFESKEERKKEIHSHFSFKRKNSFFESNDRRTEKNPIIDLQLTPKPRLWYSSFSF